MKYVSFLFAVLLFAGVAKAGEQTFSFHYNNNNAYYSCSYAEAQVVKTLTTLGAENVSTNCHGGIDHDQLWPVSVNAVYTLAAKGERTVVIEGRESCDFNVKLIKAALINFDHEVVKAQASCWDASGRYRFELIVR